MIDVTDLPADQLRKSKTYNRYVGECGRSLRCKEMTDVLDPCCGRSVEFEGGTLSYEDLWDEIEEEIKAASEPDWDAEAKEKDL